MDVLIFCIAAAVAITAGVFLYRMMFEDSDDFWECVRYSFTPNLFSLFRGQYFEDVVKSFKLSAFLGITGVTGYLTFAGLHHLLS